MGKVTPVEKSNQRDISKDEVKAEALRIIEEKLKNLEERKAEEETKEESNGFVGKKKSHFLSDVKVYVCLIIIFLLAIGAVVVKVSVFNPKLGITFSETSTCTIWSARCISEFTRACSRRPQSELSTARVSPSTSRI